MQRRVINIHGETRKTSVFASKTSKKRRMRRSSVKLSAYTDVDFRCSVVILSSDSVQLQKNEKCAVNGRVILCF